MATVGTLNPVVPGPRAWPLIGGKARLFAFYQQPFRFLRALYTTYGSVVGLSEGDASYLFGFGPAHNLQILAHPDLFATSAGPFKNVPKDSALGRLFLHNLPLMQGEQHKQQRRLMQPAFHKRQVAGYGEEMIQLTTTMLDRWQEREQIDLHREMRQLTQRITVKTLFGLDNERELLRIGVLLEHMANSPLPLALLLPLKVPGFPYTRMVRLAEHLEAFVGALITERRSQERLSSDVLSMLLRAYDDDGAQLSKVELTGHIFTLFMAGHETTSNALTWAVFLLTQHPQVLGDVVDELNSVLRGDLLTMEHVQRLPLLDGVIKETLRLLPPASIGTRVALQASELGGFRVPAGSTVVYSPFITHRMSDLYQEPDHFQPERWLTLNRTAYEFLPFGAGQHMCIGAGFALQEMKVVLSLMLPRYRLEPQPRARISLNIMTRPLHGMPMRVLAQDRRFRQVPVQGTIRHLVDF